MPTTFHVYEFQHVDPVELDIEEKLAGILTDADAYIRVDALSRTVTYRSGPELHQEIQELLQAWDREVRQVRIDAEILSVNSSIITNLGISWQALLDTNVFVDVDFPPPIADERPQGRLVVGSLEETDYTAIINALAADSDTEVIATPTILARNGAQAMFASTRDEPFTVVTVDGNTQTTLEDVRFLNIGTTLMVLPVIHPQGLISMDVQLEISDLAEIRSGIPVTDRSTAQTMVNVGDGGAVILGGLRQRSHANTGEGVPVLRKIPLLGALFRNKQRQDKQFDIILILRPQIVGPVHEGPMVAPGLPIKDLAAPDLFPEAPPETGLPLKTRPLEPPAKKSSKKELTIPR